jgi:hypothetical protein
MVPIEVSATGADFQPHLGDVKIPHLTPDVARAENQKGVEPIAASAQVQLSVAGVRNAVDLSAGKAAPEPIHCPTETIPFSACWVC